MGKYKIKDIRKSLIGTESVFDMESRIFHYVCIFSLIALGINVPVNYFIGHPALTIVLILTFVLVSVSYYLSRWMGLYSTGVVIFGLTANTLFALNFLYSSGTQGGALMYFLLSFFLTMSVMPKKQSFFWTGINVVLVGWMFFIEFYHPDWVIDQFSNIQTRYIDLSITYLIVMVMMAYITWEIRKNYHKEKNAAEKKALELARINEEKNKLFSVVAHDLRSPMSSIQNYLEALEAVSFSESEKRKIEQDLLNNTLMVNEMIDNLLTWVKSQLDGVKPNLQRLSVRKILKTTLELSKLVAHKKDINLDIDIERGTSVIADAEMLQSIMRNLISNAIKFTEPGGFVKIRAFNKENTCMFEITDNGTGITSEDKENIFSHRLKSKAGTMNEKGSALGLIICRDYLVLQNGQISLESTEGSGTTFFITLPAA